MKVLFDFQSLIAVFISLTLGNNLLTSIPDCIGSLANLTVYVLNFDN
jgi:hypothetical protein